jgi:hypothetical protein
MTSYHIYRSRKIARQCLKEADDHPNDVKNKIKAILEKQPIKVKQMAIQIIQKQLGEICL